MCYIACSCKQYNTSEQKLQAHGSSFSHEERSHVFCTDFRHPVIFAREVANLAFQDGERSAWYRYARKHCPRFDHEQPKRRQQPETQQTPPSHPQIPLKAELPPIRTYPIMTVSSS